MEWGRLYPVRFDESVSDGDEGGDDGCVGPVVLAGQGILDVEGSNTLSQRDQVGAGARSRLFCHFEWVSFLTKNIFNNFSKITGTLLPIKEDGDAALGQVLECRRVRVAIVARGTGRE